MKQLSGVRWTRVGLWVLLALLLSQTVIMLGIITGKADPAAWANLAWVFPTYFKFILVDAREYIAPIFLALVIFGVGRGYQVRAQHVQITIAAKRYGKAERESLKTRVSELTETNSALARSNLRYRQAIAVHARANELANEDEVEQRRQKAG
jgi:hypothetical protein